MLIVGYLRCKLFVQVPKNNGEPVEDGEEDDLISVIKSVKIDGCINIAHFP